MKVIFLIIVLVLATIIFVNYVNPSTSRKGILGRLKSFFTFGRGRKIGVTNGRAGSLRRELLKRVDSGTADRLIASARRRNPGKSESWYLEKVLYDLRRGR